MPGPRPTSAPFARRLAGALAIALAASACLSSSPSPPIAVPPTGPSTPAPASASPAPPASSSSASPTPSEPSTGAIDLPFGELDAGRYRNPRFTPLVTFTVDDGWTSTILNGFFDIQQRRGTPAVIAVQFANVEGVVGADRKVVRPDDAARAARLVRRNPGLEVLGSDDGRVGGLTGRVVEVRNTGRGHASILDVPPGLLGIDSGRSLWIGFFDTDDGLLAVMVGGPTDGWEEALAIAEPVLESVVIGP